MQRALLKEKATTEVMHALELRSLREDTNRRLEAQQVEIQALRRELDEQRPRMLAAWAALEALARWQAGTAVFMPSLS